MWRYETSTAIASFVCSELPYSHHFFTNSINTVESEVTLAKLRKLYAGISLTLLNQVHGTTIHVIDSTTAISPLQEGDGFFIQRRSGTPRVLVGIKTADCVPVIIANETEIALLHVGWRGLARGIIHTALSRFTDLPKYLVIGPHACAQRYEVGRDILAEFREPPAMLPHTDERKCYLGMQDSIREIVARQAPNIFFEGAPACTITDQRFFSVRRDGAGTGRNLSVIAV